MEKGAREPELRRGRESPGPHTMRRRTLALGSSLPSWNPQRSEQTGEQRETFWQLTRLQISPASHSVVAVQVCGGSPQNRSAKQ